MALAVPAAAGFATQPTGTPGAVQYATLAAAAAESHGCGQNHHAYSMEYTFPDGSVARVDNRNTSKCYGDFVTYLHGTEVNEGTTAFFEKRPPQWTGK